MKFKIKYILPIFVVLLILSFKNLSNAEFKNDIVGLKNFVKANGKILAESYTNQNGNFNLTFTPEDKNLLTTFVVELELEQFC